MSEIKIRSTTFTASSSLSVTKSTIAAVSLALVLQAGFPVGRVAAEEVDATSISNTKPDSSSRSAMDKFLDRLTIVEAGGRETAKNPLSSALGPFQFITSTFLDITRRHFLPETSGLQPAKVLALRTDRAFSRRAAAAYTLEAAAILSNNNIVPTRANLRLAYLLGAGSAVRVLKARTDTPVAGILGGAVVRANPFMKGMAAGDLARWSERNMDGRSGPDPTPVVGGSAPAAPLLSLDPSEPVVAAPIVTASADPVTVATPASRGAKQKTAARSTLRRVVTLAAKAPCRATLASCRKWLALNSGVKREIAAVKPTARVAKRPLPQRNRIVTASGRDRSA